MTPLKILPSLGKIKPSDASVSTSHVTVLIKDGYNKKPLHKIRNIYAYSFQTHKLNPYIVSDTRGSGTLYNIRKSRYFLMELHPNADLCLTKKNSFNRLKIDFPIRDTCTQPAAFVLPNNQWQCNKHFTPVLGLKGKTTQRKDKDYQTVNFNPWKEVHSTRLGLKYHVIVKRYNEWKGKSNPNLKEVMEPITTNRKGISTRRPFYKEYKNIEFYDNRTPQQVKRWNRLKKLTIKHEEYLYHNKPFLLKEDSTVYKKVSHLVEREPSYEKPEEDKLSDQLTQKRAKNWRRRVNYRNKLKKKLPTLPADFSGDARNYYFQTYNINLFAYKVRRRYDLSNIPQCQYGYLKAKRLYNNYMDRKILHPPTIRQPSPPVISRTSPSQIINQLRQPQIVPFADFASRVAQYEDARFRSKSSQNSTTSESLAPLLVKPTLLEMAYPSAKEKARLDALTNDDTPSPNFNTNDLLPRQIARPKSRKKTFSTDTVDICNTPPRDPSRYTTDSPPRPIARPRRRNNDLPPTPDSVIHSFK
ncbi:hypothetical protein RhiirA5_507037 [Rhizophagus irregularis]|uniref:Uncharacterized protein n=1 Tax=Rhizophagus irregularis TaxID=588596 RepID=A0A2N0NNL9_9GLOM|nr:hypothetical protein RhiirA5_507037 [Rhizophagus irregularis]